MIQTIIIATVVVAIVARLRWLNAQDREDRELSIAPSEPCDCEPLSDDEWVQAEADRIVLAAYMDWRIERTLEGDL